MLSVSSEPFSRDTQNSTGSKYLVNHSSIEISRTSAQIDRSLRLCLTYYWVRHWVRGIERKITTNESIITLPYQIVPDYDNQESQCPAASNSAAGRSQFFGESYLPKSSFESPLPFGIPAPCCMKRTALPNALLLRLWNFHEDCVDATFLECENNADTSVGKHTLSSRPLGIAIELSDMIYRIP